MFNTIRYPLQVFGLFRLTRDIYNYFSRYFVKTNNFTHL